MLQAAIPHIFDENQSDMKKSILIFCAVLTTLSLTAFGYVNWNNTIADQKETTCNNTAIFVNDLVKSINKQVVLDLVYNVESRFMTTITKEELHNAKSIIDILPEKATQSKEFYQNSRVSILHDDGDITEVGDSEVLNMAQLALLRSTDYSNNIRVTSICKKKHPFTGALENDSIVYYITIIPEKEAEFTDGHDALIEYLKENSKEKTAIITEDKLQPGKVLFTVTKAGTIADVKLTSTSGYPSIDKELVKIVTNTPEKWEPATNSKGEKVDQEFVFFFGLQGC